MMTRMNARFAGITLAMLSCLGPLAAAAATNIYHVVPENASSAFPFDTWETAATNIQDAVDAASAAYDPGATECVVLVTNGVYTPAGQITITNGITLRSVNGRDATVIDGNMPVATNRCLLIRDAIGRVTVDGFTVRNGYCFQQAAGGGVYVTNSQASILNCTITRNRSSGTASGLGNGGGIGVASSSGILITNCLISLNTNAPGILAHGAGVYIVQSKGLMADCVVSGNQQTANGSYGGGIYMVVPLASDFVVSNCVVAANHSHDVGGGIYVSGGTVTRCQILNNDSRNSAGGVQLYSSTSLMTYSLIASNRAGTAGGGVQMNNTSRMYNCEVVYNYCGATGGGLNNSAGIVRNCLFAGNQAVTNGGGVFWPANTTELSGCTIVRNYSGGIGGGIYVGVANANITNCIVYGNQASVTNNAGPHINALSYSCVPEITAGLKGNIAGNPLFAAEGSGAGTNAVPGDYRLQTNSPCVGAGTNLGWMAADPVVDLASLPRLRPLWGRVDMGAYEAYPAGGALTNDFYALPVTGAAPLQVTFYGETSGNTNGLLYRWDFGDGEASAWSTDASALHTYAPSSAACTVTLQTTNALGELAVRTRAAYIRVYPAIAYVSTNGLHLPPFETWEKAATNIQSAVNEAGAGFTTVLVSNGVYTVWNEIAITSAITLRSVSGDWNDTVIRGSYPAVANRCLTVNAAGALVDGFTITNGVLATADQGGGILLSAGTVRNCLVTGCRTPGQSTSGGGGGVYVGSGGILRDSTIRGNSANYDGGGIHTGGLVSNCLVTGNTTAGITAGNGGGVRIGGGLVDRCVIVGNVCSNTTGGGGGVAKANSGTATIRNCLIAGNLAKNTGGGLQQSAGSGFNIQNCTIANNVALNGGGVNFLAGVHQGVNCIVAFNRATAFGGAGDIGGAVAPSFTYSCSPGLGGGGNVAGDPLFLESGAGVGFGFAPGNYRLAPGSPAIDSASAAGAPALDLDGAARPENGDNSGAAAYDMGAYEAGAGGEGDLRCGFAAPVSRAAESLEAAFTAYAAGADTNGLYYFWDFGDGATSDWSAASRTVSHAYGCGTFSVTLGVSNELGQTAFHTWSDYIRVHPAHVHVATNGASVSPYADWGTAATNLQQAVETAAEGYGYTLAVLVSGGVYTVGREITVTNPVTVRGFSGNWDDAVIRGGYPATTNRLFNLNNPGAIVEWLTVTNGRVPGSTHGGGFFITAGTVRNCLVIGNSSPGYQGGGIYMMGGIVSNCAILNNSVGNIAGGGIAMQGAYQVVKNCLIAGNSAGTGVGGGVSIEGGFLDGCVISNNTARSAGGLYQRAGSIAISNCVIVANSAAHTGGGVGFLPASGAGIFRNCLIAGNTAVSNGGGVAAASAAARFENCTIAGNTAGLGGGWHQTAAATGVNCIVYYNESTNASAPADLGGAFTNFIASCSPALAGGVSNITANPVFVRSGSGYGTNLTYGDYRLRFSSPAADAGAPLSWMGDATDLAGDPRIQGAAPNMGAYEKVLGVPGVLFLIR